MSITCWKRVYRKTHAKENWKFSPKEIFKEMLSILQNSVALYKMMKKWAWLFQQRRETYEDGTDRRDQRKWPGSLKISTGWSKITERLEISKTELGRFCINIWMCKQNYMHFVPRMLTPFNKQRGLEHCKNFL